jgi:hypothetical protein
LAPVVEQDLSFRPAGKRKMSIIAKYGGGGPMTEKKMTFDMEGYLKPLMDTVQRVITDPAGFYREMPKSGGYVDPIIFIVSMGVVAGIIQAILGIVGLGVVASFFIAVASIIIVPIFAVIGGFIGAGILYLIWKALGSQEPFEVAFRCLAYAMAISPITTVLNIIPYIGPILPLAWMTYLLVAASTEAHEVQAKMAWIVFGAIAVVLALISINSQLAARRAVKHLNSLQNTFQNIDKMKPEEAGQAMGEFLKGLQKGSGKQ